MPNTNLAINPGAVLGKLVLGKLVITVTTTLATAQGDSTASAVGISAKVSAASAPGDSTATAVGAARAATTATAPGTSTAAGVGLALTPSSALHIVPTVTAAGLVVNYSKETFLNNVRTTLALAHSPGDGIIQVAAGTGALFGNIFPIRISCQRASDKAIVIFFVNTRSNDTLFISPAIEGTTDISLAVGDACQARLTAGAVTTLQNNQLYSTTTPTTGTVGGIPAGSTFSNAFIVDVMDQMLHAAPGSGPGPPATIFSPLGYPYFNDVQTINASYNSWLGGFTAGRYLYLAADFGNYFVRMDTGDFQTTAAINLGAVNAMYKHIGGGFTDGRYGYLIISYWNQPTAPVLRIDLADFTTNTLQVLDMSVVDTRLKDCLGAVTDGLYGYTMEQNGLLVRFSLANFTAGASAITVLDLNPMLGGSNNYVDGTIGCLDTDGKNIYCMWITDHANVSVTPISNFSVAATTILSFAPYGARGNSAYKWFRVVGDYIYLSDNVGGFSPAGLLYKLNKHDNTDLKQLNLGAVNPVYKDFCGGFSDPQGRYLYLGPNNECTWVVRVDLSDFQTVEGVNIASWLPANSSSEFLCLSGFTDGRFGYMLSDYPGCLLRFQLFPGGHF